MNLQRLIKGGVALCAAGCLVTACWAGLWQPAGVGDAFSTISLASRPGMERGNLLAPAETTIIKLRGPTRDATPLDFEYDLGAVISYIEKYLAGGHLSTKEMCYVLRAYEQDYRCRMEHPRVVTPLFAYANGPAKPQLAGLVRKGTLRD